MTTVIKVGGSLCADPGRLRTTLAGIAAGTHGPCIVVPGGGALADAVRARQALEGFDDATAHRFALDAMGRMGGLFRALEPRLGRTERPWMDGLLPLPSAGEGGLRSGSGEGSDGAGYGAPLSRPSPTRGPPSPMKGGGKSRIVRVPREICGSASARDGERTASAVWDPVALRAGHPDIPETWDVTSDSLALWLAARLCARRCALVKSADAPPACDAAGLARLGLVDAAFPAFAARFSGTIAVWGPAGPVALARRAAA